MPRLISVVSLCSLLVFAAALPLDAGQTLGDDRAVANLAAFARVYGYVRFFHPSDEAAAINWDSLGVIGAEAVRDASSHDDLRDRLLRIFQPIAPTMVIGADESPASVDSSKTSGGRRIFWQHLGVKLDEKPGGPYQQRRVIIGGGSDKEHAPLFQPAIPPAPLVKTIAPGLVLHLPLALPVARDGKTSPSTSPAFLALQTKLGETDLGKLKAEDWRLRVAGITSVWNIFQHFHPYLDGIGVKWDEALEPALRRALSGANEADYRAAMWEMIAKSQDGHGCVFPPVTTMGGMPIRAAVVEGQVVTTGLAAGAPFQRGDIIEKIDGVAALDVLRERERYVSGSPHLRRFRALNQFGEGALGTKATLEITRDGAAQTIEVTREEDRRGYFFNSIGEFEFPAFAEIRPGIFYVNLYSLDLPAYEDKLPQLTSARGVIFDWRWDGRKAGEGKRIQPHSEIIPHLISEPVQASPMLVPQISAPDRVGWTYRESSWPVKPKAPRFAGKVVFINEPSVVSYGETCMAMLADYHLVTLVGESTAGCNGNANFIPLPGGFQVMWTGMDVIKHDRTPFYGVGFVPDFPVTRTIRAVKEGRDEFLEKAIEVIEQSVKPARPSQTGQN